MSTYRENGRTTSLCETAKLLLDYLVLRPFVQYLASWNIKYYNVTLVFIVAPCILISSKSFTYQQMHCILVWENNEIYVKTYIKIAATCFGLRPLCTSHSAHTWYNMLPHNRIVHNDVLLPIILINVALVRLICKLPDDGRKPKHVAAILM